MCTSWSLTLSGYFGRPPTATTKCLDFIKVWGRVRGKDVRTFGDQRDMIIKKMGAKLMHMSSNVRYNPITFCL